MSEELVPGTQFKSLIEQDMQDSYLRYSMSVIVARALPDARDGFKLCTAASCSVCTSWAWFPTSLP